MLKKNGQKTEEEWMKDRRKWSNPRAYRKGNTTVHRIHHPSLDERKKQRMTTKAGDLADGKCRFLGIALGTAETAAASENI